MGKEPLTREQVNYLINLRKHGKSFPEIRRTTGFGSGTIFKYLKGVKILPEFIGEWEKRRKFSTFRMQGQERMAIEQAGSIIKTIGSQEKILIAAILYWAEGQKRDFSLSNTDPVLIKVFVECLKEFGIKKEDIKVNIRTYEDLDRNEVCKFWAKVLEISESAIGNVNVLKGKKHGKLQYGMCRIRVKKAGYLLKLLHAIKDIIGKQISPL